IPSVYIQMCDRKNLLFDDEYANLPENEKNIYDKFLDDIEDENGNINLDNAVEFCQNIIGMEYLSFDNICRKFIPSQLKKLTMMWPTWLYFNASIYHAATENENEKLFGYIGNSHTEVRLSDD